MSNLSATNEGQTNGGGSLAVVLVQPALIIEQQVYDTAQPAIAFAQIIDHVTASLSLTVTQRVYDTAITSLAIQQTIVHATEAPALTIRQEIIGTEQPTLAIRQYIIEQPAWDHWRVAVTIDGTDYTAAITGEIRIEHSEDSSGIAELSMLLDAGSFDPDTWTGKPITIDYIALDSTGADAWTARRFTGIIIEPQTDTDTGLAKLTCSTDLQRRIYAMDNDAIDSLVGGLWSDKVFDSTASAWRYANDRLSTRQASLFATPRGDLRVSEWAPGATDHHVIDDTNRVADTLSASKAERSGLVNRVYVTVDFRFTRLRQRDVRHTWNIGGGLCDYLQGGYKLPTRAAIQQAAEGTGWTIIGGSPSYIPVWPSQGVTCSNNYGSVNIAWAGWPSIIDKFCIGFGLILSKRWAQTVTESHYITVESPASIAANGLRAVSEEYGIDSGIDASVWEEEETEEAAPGSAVIHSTQITGTPAPNGDMIFDADALPGARDALNAALECIVAKARAEIARTHRANTIQTDMPLSALPELHQDARITTATLTGRGRISAITDTLDTATGRAVSRITISISRIGGVGIPDPEDESVEPQKPDSTAEADEYESSVSLPTHIGGRSSSAVFSDEWTGWTTNYFPRDVGAPVYTERFVINAPTVGDAGRQATTVAADYTVTANVRNDTYQEAY